MCEASGTGFVSLPAPKPKLKKLLRCEGRKKYIQELPAGARDAVGDDTALPAASTTGFLWDIFKQIPVNPSSEAKLEESTELSSAQGRGEGGEASCLTWLLPPWVSKLCLVYKSLQGKGKARGDVEGEILGKL